MTAARRDGNETEFQEWLREHPELDSHAEKLSATDCDMWVHRYSARDERNRTQTLDVRDAVDSIMLVEVKTFAAEVPYAQRDTLTVVDALLRMACMLPSGRRKHVTISDGRLNHRTTRRVRCFGVHLLVLSHGRPDKSNVIRWDRSFLHESALLELLRFERDPDAPSKSLDTRRHHMLKPRPTLHLFDRPDEAA